MRRPLSTLAALVAGTAVAVTAAPAFAKCTKLGFSVNDYGKDGPTKDAKALLDKYIADWAAKNGIKSYTTGKKDVKCELFLNFIVFDEHTCKAEATVCWNEAAAPGAAAPSAKAAAPAATKPAASKPAAAKPKAAGAPQQ